MHFQRNTHKHVAMKVTECDATDKRRVVHFTQEVSALKRVAKILSIIKCYSAGSTTKYSYLATQLASGGNLRQYVALHKSLPEMEVKHIFKQLLTTVKVSQ
jgi:serine/threonine protein kinase